jgi:hypothetical protein
MSQQRAALHEKYELLDTQAELALEDETGRTVQLSSAQQCCRNRICTLRTFCCCVSRSAPVSAYLRCVPTLMMAAGSACGVGGLGQCWVVVQDAMYGVRQQAQSTYSSGTSVACEFNLAANSKVLRSALCTWLLLSSSAWVTSCRCSQLCHRRQGANISCSIQFTRCVVLCIRHSVMECSGPWPEVGHKLPPSPDPLDTSFAKSLQAVVGQSHPDAAFLEFPEFSNHQGTYYLHGAPCELFTVPGTLVPLGMTEIMTSGNLAVL